MAGAVEQARTHLGGLNVLVNWGWSYVTYDRGARLIVRAYEPVRPDTRSGSSLSPR